MFRELATNFSAEAYAIAFLVIEHVLLGLTWFIYKAIPDTPLWVRVALAKADYESRQALKREVSFAVCEVSLKRVIDFFFLRFDLILTNQAV